jgi:hypothetical protein
LVRMRARNPIARLRLIRLTRRELGMERSPETTANLGRAGFIAPPDRHDPSDPRKTRSDPTSMG